MQRFLTRLAILFLLLLSSGGVFAQEREMGKVRLRTGVVSLESYALFAASKSPAADSGLWLV